MNLDKESFQFEFPNKTIYAIGDIHGDITPLIVCLRDCCQVIKKKEGFFFNQKERDKDLVLELIKEWDDYSYSQDLNYQWCGGDSIVILCGDIINNSRSGKNKVDDYPFEEARILIFINQLNKQAMLQGGRIFKLIGNHDFDNINMDILSSPYKGSLVTPFSAKYLGYQKGFDDKIYDKNRFTYFNRGNPGSKLYAEDKSFLFLFINDFIFVHGGISSDLFKIENLKNLNDKFNKYLLSPTDFTFNCGTLEHQLTNGPDGIIKCRYYGSTSNITEDNKCKKINETFDKLNTELLNLGINNKNFKLVVGHSTQNKFVNKNFTYYNTFDKVINIYFKDDIIVNHEFYSEEIYNGDEKKIDFSGNKIIINNGISVSCNKNKIPQIYRLDVGLSRGAYNFQNNDTDEYLYSRTPQVLKIIYIDFIPKVSIIKSSVENTRIHVPGIEISNDDIKGGGIYQDKYKIKYFKYKTKYLDLKYKKL
jgi:hypothetical protein